MSEHDVAMRVNAVISSIADLDGITANRQAYPLIQMDEEDLQLAYAKLGRLRTRLRFPVLRAG